MDNEIKLGGFLPTNLTVRIDHGFCCCSVEGKSAFFNQLKRLMFQSELKVKTKVLDDDHGDEIRNRARLRQYDAITTPPVRIL